MKESRKGLGMGLDLLLKASSQEPPNKREQGDLLFARGLYKQALEQEDQDNDLEAYYYYRRIIDLWPHGKTGSEAEKAKLMSEALNNAATILFEHGKIAPAIEFLEKALKVDAANETARENLNIIRAEA